MNIKLIKNTVKHYKEKAVSLFVEKKEKALKPPTLETVSYSTDDSYEINYNDRLGGDPHSIEEKILEIEETDPRIPGYVDTLILEVLALPRKIIGEGPEADYARDMFSNFNNFHNTAYQMIYDSVVGGVSFTEKVWGKDSGKYIIEKLLPRCRTNFEFDKDNNLRVVNDKYADGRIPKFYKYAVMTFQGKHGNRNGIGLYNRIYWYWFLKKHSLKYRALFVERFAMPIVTAKPGDGVTLSKNQISQIDSFISNIRTGTGVLLPRGVIVEFLEANRSGGADCYESFLSYLDKGIVIGILSQTLTSDSDGKGSYAQGKVHEIRLKNKIKSIINMFESVINDDVIRQAIDFNFQNVKEYPKFRIIYKDAVDLEIMAKVIELLVKSGHNQIPMEWINETFGIPVLKDDQKVLTIQNSAPKQDQFSEDLRKANIETYKEELKALGI